jgi:hypothetical protein
MVEAKKDSTYQRVSLNHYSVSHMSRDLTTNRYLTESKTQKTVTVKLSLGIGKSVRTWALAEELLCDHSSYFRALFQGNFKEGSEKKSLLDEELFTEKAVCHLIDWMYTGKLECLEDHDHNQRSSKHDASWYSLYVLADMLDMFWLAKATISRIRRCLEEGRWLPNEQEIQFVYKNTLEDSPLRERVVTELVDAYLEQTEKTFNEDAQHWTDTAAYHPDFHCDVMKALKHHIGLTECDRPVTCRWHFYQKSGRKRRTIR